MRPRPGDLGIIFAKNGAGSGSYTDIADQAQAFGQLTTSYTEQQPALSGGVVDYSHPWLGASEALSLFCTVTLSGATAIKVKLQGRADSAAPWADLQSARENTGVVAAEHALGAGTVVIQTSSSMTVPQVRVVAAATAPGALAAGDQITVKGRVV